MKRYCRFNIHEREELSRQLAMRVSYRTIAQRLQRSVSTISREVKRCYNWYYYRACVAQAKAQRLASQPRRQPKLEINIKLRSSVIALLQEQWSPQQIANRLKFMYPNDMTMHVSHETIYAYLYVKPRPALRKQLVKCLRRGHKNRRIVNPFRRNTSPIQDYRSIDERPLEVNERVIPGHWEGDLMFGRMNHSALGVLVERKTRKALLVKLTSQDSASVRKAFAAAFRTLPKNLKKTLTYDQGREMAQHKLFTKQTKIDVYFAHPRSPWERGSSENTNGLLRQYFPKGTDFLKVSQKEINRVQESLNNRPRQTLNWFTPNEVFAKTVALEL